MSLTPPMTDSSLDYASVVHIPGLDGERGQQLVEHILRSNEALPDRPPIPLPVARCAAALLAAEPNRLSSPTALAQAVALAHRPTLGPAVMHLHEGLMLLTDLKASDLAAVGVHQAALRHTLQCLIERATDLIQRT